jgi:hypothetical protein
MDGNDLSSWEIDHFEVRLGREMGEGIGNPLSAGIGMQFLTFAETCFRSETIGKGCWLPESPGHGI